MFLTIVQIAVCVLLVGCILLQMQGGGLPSAFGGGGQFYRSKRSVEKLLMWATVILTLVFAVVSITLLLPR